MNFFRESLCRLHDQLDAKNHYRNTVTLIYHDPKKIENLWDFKFQYFWFLMKKEISVNKINTNDTWLDQTLLTRICLKHVWHFMILLYFFERRKDFKNMDKYLKFKIICQITTLLYTTINDSPIRMYWSTIHIRSFYENLFSFHIIL